jgi:type I restriction enzyme, S subunit
MQELHKFKKIELGKIPDEWNLDTLIEFVDDKTDIVAGPFGSNLKVSDYKSNGVPIIRLQNIQRNKFINENIRYISQEKAEELKYHSYKPNDIVLAKLGDPIGKTCIIPENVKGGIVVADVVRIRPSLKKTDTKFLEYALNSDLCSKQMNGRYIGTTRPRVNLDQIRYLKLFKPPLKEQQKIASIISKVDELIQKTEQIIEQTQRLKKGLMQRLLTKGIGHTKFEKVIWNYGKKIEIPKEWKIVFLDEVTKRGTGHTPDAKKPEYYNGGIKWVSLADSDKLDNLYISETTKEISEMGIKNSSAVKHLAGTVILSRDAGVGKSAILKTEMAVSQHFIAWHCGQNLNNYFLYYLLQYWKPFFESIAIGTTIKTIGLPFFKKLRIPLPPIEEQRKISFSLLNVDKLIQRLKRKKVDLGYLKKGLMQQLLTGKIRVKV